MARSQFCKNTKTPFRVGDLEFTTNKECATFFGRSVSVVRTYRMRGQLDCLLDGTDYKNTHVEYRNLRFPSISAFALAIGKHRATVHRRLISNTLQELEPAKGSEVWHKLYGNDGNR